MYHDVSAVLQRTNQIRCAESVVDDEGDAVLVGYGSHTFKVKHIGIWVTESLGIYYFCVGLDSSFQSLEVVDINYGIGNALRSQRVGNKVVGAAIEVVGSNDMVAILHDVLQGVGDGGSTRGHGQTGYATFKGCDTIFEHALG